MRRISKDLMIIVFLVLFILVCGNFSRIASVQADQGSRWQGIGPSAGTIQQIEPHRGISNVVFAINNKHLYRSVDFGRHWQQKPLENVLDVQIHVRTGLIFAITEVLIPKSYLNGSALFVSADGGNSFKLISQEDFPLAHIRIHYDNPDVLFAWGYEFYKSVDGGRHWDLVADFPNTEYDDFYYSVRDVVFSPFDSQTVFAAVTGYIDHGPTDDIIMESHNLGKKWKSVFRSRDHSGLPFSFHHDPVFFDRVLAYGTGRGLLKLTPQGWTPVSDFGILQLAGDPHRRSRLFALRFDDICELRLYQSLDEGLSWDPVAKDLHGRISSIAVPADKNKTLLGGTHGGGLFRRQGNGNWKHSSAGMKDAVITHIAVDNSSNLPFAVSDGVPYLYPNSRCSITDFFYVKKSHSLSWKDVTFRLPLKKEESILDLDIDPFDPSHAYLVRTGYTSNRVVVTFDRGKTWIESLFDEYPGYPILTQDKKHPNVVYASGYDFFKSVDGGRTFHKLPLDFSAFRANGNNRRVVIDENDSNVLYFLFSGSGIFRSTDGGVTMSPVASDPPRGGWAMAQLPERDAFLLLSNRGKVYRTTNAGQTWKELSRVDDSPRRFFSTRNTAILAADQKGRHFFATLNDRYLYESVDGGLTWSDVTEEFGPDTEVREMTDPRSSAFFVATSSGVFMNQNLP